MEYIDGCKLTQLETEYEKQLANKLLIEAYGQQIFTHGIVHVDPHPGNIFVRRIQQKASKSKDTLELVFLDHGLYRELDPVLRLHYSKLYLDLVKGGKNYNTIVEFINKYYNIKGRCDNPYVKDALLYWRNRKEFLHLFASMILSYPYRNTNSNDSFIPGLYDAYHRKREDVRQYSVNHLYDMIEILSQLPSDLLLLMKTSELLRSLFSKLEKGQQICMYPSRFSTYALKALQEHSYLRLKNELSKRSWLRIQFEAWRKLFEQRVECFKLWLKLNWYYWLYCLIYFKPNLQS
jgi:aarF domain-containing kinase